MEQKKETRSILKEGLSKRLLGGILLLLFAIVMIDSKAVLGLWITYALSYLFGSFVFVPVSLLLILGIYLLIGKTNRRITNLCITYFLSSLFLQIALSSSSIEKMRELFTEYHTAFNEVSSAGIYKIVGHMSQLRGGSFGFFLNCSITNIFNRTAAEMVGYVCFSICLIIIVFQFIFLFKEVKVSKTAKKAKKLKAKKAKQVQEFTQPEVKKFSFGGQEEQQEEAPVLSANTVEDIQVVQNSEPYTVLPDEIIEPVIEEEKQQYADDSMDDFDIFNDDLLAGKSFSTLIDNIEGGDDFDIFNDDVFDENAAKEFKQQLEVKDLTDEIFVSDPITETALYKERSTVTPVVEETTPVIEETPVVEEDSRYNEDSEIATLISENLGQETTEEANDEVEEEYVEDETIGFPEDYEEPVVEETPAVEEEITETTIEESSVVEETPRSVVSEVVEEAKPVEEEKPEPVKQVKINKNYKLPPLSLLENPVAFDNTDNLVEAKIKEVKLNAKLVSLGIKAKVKDFRTAPSFTRFQIEVENNVKINVFQSIKNDLMMALSATTISILAPIPGTPYVGVDIPNVKRSMVTFKECLMAVSPEQEEDKLLMVTGKDISNEMYSFKLNSTPHLLVAGTTGAGKSAGLNSFIISILMRCKPTEVKLVLIDPKKTEFSPYAGIPHLLCPVIVDCNEASSVLQRVAREIDIRNAVFSSVGRRNIDGYNRLMKEKGKEPMPYIVCIIDELANLMLAARAQVEDSIAKIASLARSAGIHLVVATQRPSVDVITGVIKANIPSRIAFTVSSYTDSRTILDDGGADTLLGKGDMLVKIAGKLTTDRVQGCYLSDEEVERVADYVRDQQEPLYDDEFCDLNAKEQQAAAEAMENEMANAGIQTSGYDDLYEQVIEFIRYQDECSVSMLRRHFSLGQPKAGRIIDDLTADGYITPPEGNKPRKVLHDRLPVSEG